MSTPNPQPGVPTAPERPAPKRREIFIVSHCGLFYWWPVWAVSFLMGLITTIENHRLAIVPADTHAYADKIDMKDETKNKKGEVVETRRDALIVPRGTHLPKYPGEDDPEQPHLRMSNNKNLGVLFCAVLLLVIAITNIPLRGLWSVIVIVFVISLVIIFGLLDWWTIILHHLSFLDIRINAGGYFVIAGILFALWLAVMLVFDRQIYMVFTSGQLRVRQEIGDAETAFDTTGMTIQKQRSDLFRHWILGLGSGDLIVKTAGANQQEFHMPNVLFVGRKVNEIEEMLRQRQVVSGQNQ